MTMFLNKIEMLKVTIFFKYFQENLLPSIKADMRSLKEKVKKFISNGDYINSFEKMGQELFNLDVLFVYIKASLASRKSSNSLFFNNYFSENLESSMKELRDCEIEHSSLKKNIGWIGEFISDIDNFFTSCSDLDKADDIINNNRVSLESYKNAEALLLYYNSERIKAENFIRAASNINVDIKNDIESKLKLSNRLYKKLKEDMKSLSI